MSLGGLRYLLLLLCAFNCAQSHPNFKKTCVEKAMDKFKDLFKKSKESCVVAVDKSRKQLQNKSNELMKQAEEHTGRLSGEIKDVEAAVNSKVQDEGQSVKEKIEKECHAVKTENKLELLIIKQLVKNKEKRNKLRFESLKLKANVLDQKADAMQNKTELIEQRLESIEEKTESIDQRIESIENKTTSTDERMKSIEQKVGSIDARMESIEDSVSALNTTVTSMTTLIVGLVAQSEKITPVPEDCGEVFSQGQTQPGVYSIKIHALGKKQVFCDSGFTTFQRRQRGDENFDRVLRDYAKGFGAANSDHWLGLEALHALTSRQSCSLRVELVIDLKSTNSEHKEALSQSPEDGNGEIKWIEYSTFSVGSADHFKLSVDGGSTNLNNSANARYYMLNYSNGRSFSTKDRDLAGSRVNCANHPHRRPGGGWWYGVGCSHKSPNSSHKHKSFCASDNRVCIYWYPYFLRSVHLKLRC